MDGVRNLKFANVWPQSAAGSEGKLEAAWVCSSAALASAASLIEGKMSKDLKKFLKGVFAKDAHEKLAVADAKLGQAIKSKLEIDCVADSSVSELMRCIRSQLANIMPSVDDNDLKIMSLGLGHSLSRYKLKFSPDKIDTMIVQVSKFKVFLL